MLRNLLVYLQLFKFRMCDAMFCCVMVVANGRLMYISRI
jgi:hypothetical protein